MGICFFDLAKAFDTVWHKGLLYKLKYYGVSGKLLSLLKSYLTNRTQCGKVGTAVSSSASLLSGVPQGSILGPLLFLIFVNDLPNLVPIVSLYADDTAVIDSATSLATLENSMQSKINAVVAWMRKWRLHPNVKKTKSNVCY